MIAAGEVQLVVNTPSGSGARADGALIRGACVVHAVSCLTTISAGLAAAKGIADTRAQGWRVALAPGAAPMSDLSTSVGAVALRSAILTAAGTSGYGDELAGYGDLRALGRRRRQVAGRLRVGGQPGAARRGRRASTWSTPSVSRARASRRGANATCRTWNDAAATSWPRSGAARSRSSPSAAEAMRGAERRRRSRSTRVVRTSRADRSIFAHSALATAEIVRAVQGGRSAALDQTQPEHAGPGRDRRRRARRRCRRARARQHRARARPSTSKRAVRHSATAAAA